MDFYFTKMGLKNHFSYCVRNQLPDSTIWKLMDFFSIFALNIFWDKIFEILNSTLRKMFPLKKIKNKNRNKEKQLLKSRVYQKISIQKAFNKLLK